VDVRLNFRVTSQGGLKLAPTTGARDRLVSHAFHLIISDFHTWGAPMVKLKRKVNCELSFDGISFRSNPTPQMSNDDGECKVMEKPDSPCQDVIIV
jgi:hypothetical protein